MKASVCLFLISFLLFACGDSSSEKEEPKAQDPLANIKLSTLTQQTSVALNPAFHQRAISFEQQEGITVVHHWDLKIEEEGMIEGASKLTINNLYTGKKYNYGKSIEAFLLLEKEILVVEKDEEQKVVMSKIDFEGNLITSERLIDPTYNEDICYEMFDFVIGKKCGQSQQGEVRLYRHDYPYQAVQLKRSQLNKEEFFVLLDTSRYSTNVYKVSFDNQGLKLLKKRQLLVHNNLYFLVFVDLMSGSEMHTLNRFGKHLEKVFGLTKNDEVIFGAQASYAKAQNRFLGLTPDGDDPSQAAKPYSYFVKLDSDLNKKDELFYEPIFSSIADYLVTAKSVDDHLYFGLTTSRGNRDGQFDFELYSLDTENMTIKKSKKIDLARSDYLTGLSVYKDQVVASSFTGVGQNPSGYSIGGFGAIGLSFFNLDLELEKSMFFRPATRKNVLIDFKMDDSGFLGLFDLDGPVTHTADRNKKLNSQSTSLLLIDFPTSKIHWF